MATTAERRGDTFVLNGTKTFITNAPVANMFVVSGEDRALHRAHDRLVRRVGRRAQRGRDLGGGTCSTFRNVSARPRRIWLRITPELPRAPMSDPCAIAWQTSGMASAEPSSCTTDSRVSVMFVPVSPSGTG